MPYSGLTVITSHPSRFDAAGLITGGYAKTLFEQSLRPLSRYECDIRLVTDTKPLRPGTKVVLLMGQASLSRLGPAYKDKPLQEIRGYPYWIDGVCYIPTFHHQDAVDIQAYEKRLNSAYYEGQDGDDEGEEDDGSNQKDKGRTSRRNYRFWFAADVRKAVRGVRGQFAIPSQSKFVLRPDATTAIELLRGVAEQTIYFDIETNPKTNQLICFSWCGEEGPAYAVPIISYSGHLFYTERETSGILRALSKAFNRNAIVIHNSLFDLPLLAWKYRIVPPPQAQIYDTMIAHHRTYTEVEKSLAHCISLYTWEPYHKDEANFFPRSYEEETKLLQYNAKDVLTLRGVKRGIEEHAKLWGAEASIAQGNSYVRPSMLMTLRGIRADVEAMNTHSAELVRYAAFFESRVLPRLVGYPLNPRSPKQVHAYLYKQLGLKCVSNDAPTGKKALYSLRLKHNIPALSVILRLRQVGVELGKLKSKLWQTDRWTGAYVITGTKTFRLGSRKYMGYGSNMQNFKKQWRRFCVPEPGHVLVQVDQAGAEALIVAYLTKAGKMRDFFNYKVKPHTYNAAKLFEAHWCELLGVSSIADLFELPISQVKSWKHWKDLETAIKKSDNDIPARRYYYISKQGVHSGNYDVQARSLVMNILDKSEGAIALPVTEGDRIIRTYHGIVPEVRSEFHPYVRNQVTAHRCLRNLFGFPRLFGGALDDTLMREAYAQIPQSTVGCITNIAHSEIQQKLDVGEYEGFCIIQNNHDSLLAMCPESKSVEVAKILTTHMQRELVNPWGEKFRMGAEASVGPNWYDMEEINL